MPQCCRSDNIRNWKEKGANVGKVRAYKKKHRAKTQVSINFKSMPFSNCQANINVSTFNFVQGKFKILQDFLTFNISVHQK